MSKSNVKGNFEVGIYKQNKSIFKKQTNKKNQPNFGILAVDWIRLNTQIKK